MYVGWTLNLKVPPRLGLRVFLEFMIIALILFVYPETLESLKPSNKNP